MRPVRLPILLVVLVLGAGCVRDIEVENQEAIITSVGPLEIDARSNVVVLYTIRDAEGDDEDVRVEICEAPEDDCGTAVEGLGGDPTQRVPTVPQGTDVLHEFRWNPWCGRYVGTDRVTTELATEYVAAVRVLRSETPPVVSSPFTLEGLGVVEARDCE